MELSLYINYFRKLREVHISIFQNVFTSGQRGEQERDCLWRLFIDCLDLMTINTTEKHLLGLLDILLGYLPPKLSQRHISV